MLNNELEKAVNLSLQLLKIDNTKPKILYILANSYYLLGNNLGALKVVNELMQIKVSKEAFELRGDIYMETGTYVFAAKLTRLFLPPSATAEGSYLDANRIPHSG